MAKILGISHAFPGIKWKYISDIYLSLPDADVIGYNKSNTNFTFNCIDINLEEEFLVEVSLMTSLNTLGESIRISSSHYTDEQLLTMFNNGEAELSIQGIKELYFSVS